MEKYKGLRDLIDKIVAISGVDAIDLAKLKQAIIDLAYEIDNVEEDA